MGCQQQRRRRGRVVDLHEMRDGAVTAQDDMRIRTAKSEGIDADQFRPALVGQAAVLADNLEVEVVERNVGIGRALMQRRRHQTAVEGHYGFQQARQATTPARDGRHWILPEPMGRGLRALLGEALAKRVGLDRIADPRAGTVRLDKTQVSWIDAEVAINLLEQPALRIGRWQRQAGGAAILVHARTNDHRMDAAAGLQRRGHRPEDHDDRAFGADIAIGRRVERPA